MYGSSYMFRHYIAIFRSVSSVFWEMLNWEAVDRILLMGVLCLVTWLVHHAIRHNTPIHNTRSTAHQLVISHKALGTPPKDDNLRPKHVGTTIDN
jgi:uncharacterized membrane protein YhfC